MRWLSALFVVVILSACVSHRHELYDARTQFEYTMPANAPLSAFSYDNSTPPDAEYFPIPARTLEGYEVSGMRFPSTGNNGQPDNAVSARYYRSRHDPFEPKPLLIVLPIWATHTFPSTVISQGYGLHSEGEVNILWMDGDEPVFDWLSMRSHTDAVSFESEIDESVERYRSLIIDVRRLIDWAEERPEIDTRRIALVGFSMSALVAANVAGIDPRVHTTVLVLGGALPWEVMSECGLIVGYMRNGVKKKLGWSQQEFRNFFQEKLAVGDPVNWQGRYRSENTLIIEASRDDCMPESSRDALWQATGKPERIIFPYNHWQPFLALTPVGSESLSEDIFSFLDRKLLPEKAYANDPLTGMFCELTDPSEN